MNIILYAVDFSKNSEKALQHAVKFAGVLNTKLVLFNAYTIPIYEIDLAVPEINFYEKTNFVRTKLENLKKEIEKEYRLKNVSCVARPGNPVNEIIKYAKEIKADWIVLGARGASTFKKIVLGSTANGVLEKAGCPVLVIPSKAKSSEIKEIIFATQLETNELPIIKEAVAFAKIFNSNITFVYIGKNTKAENLKFNTFNEALLKEINYKKISFKKVSSSNVFTGINSVIKSHHADLIMMVAHPGGALKKSFGGSNIRKMFFHTKVPLLVYHSLGTILPIYIDPAEILI